MLRLPPASGRKAAIALLVQLLFSTAEVPGTAPEGTSEQSKEYTRALAHHNSGCSGWNLHYLPQTSFWAEQVWRRQKSVVDPADSEAVAQVTTFAHQAAFFMCVVGLDPRKGTTWSEPTVEYFKTVAAAEGLVMPPPPKEPFANMSNISSDGFSAGGPCTWWAEQMLCDLGWWTRLLKGSKDYGDGLCWDRIQHPGFQFTSNGYLAQTLMRHHAPRGLNQRYHPEYMECMDGEFNNTIIDSLCPLGGYMPDGALGVPHWGDGVPLGIAREEVDQCHLRTNAIRLANMTDQEKVQSLTPSSPSIGLW